MKNECKMWNGVKVFMCKACDKFHGFCNPNCSQIDDRDYEIVKALAGKGDERGIFEDFEHDNY